MISRKITYTLLIFDIIITLWQNGRTSIVRAELFENHCVQRAYAYDSVVCVCNSTFCDTVPHIFPILRGTATTYTSSQSGQRFQKSMVKWDVGRPESNLGTDDISVMIDFSRKFQKIDGFGGAFTDAFGINVNQLPLQAQNNLLSSYFGPNSIQYNIGRIPIASCDFSTTNYSYDDVIDDFELKYFNLTEYDLQFKIPLIKRAMKLANGNLKLIAAPWSAPFWMKTNQMMQGVGKLIGKPGGKYFKTWANYFIRFLDAYAKHGIRFWVISAQNEPSTGFSEHFHLQRMGYTPQMQRDFIKYDLGPAFEKSMHKNVGLMILDDNRHLLPKWPEIVLNDPKARKYVSHIGFHWYLDSMISNEILDETKELFPDVSLFGTEACIGVDSPTKEFVKLGSWDRAERYAENILNNLNHWYTGWMDWNLALDTQGGPNWIENFVDSSIIVNASSGEFYKQPIFYAIGHFSTFITKGSRRVDFTVKHSDHNDTMDILVTSFLRPDGYKVAVIVNKKEKAIVARLQEANVNYSLKLNIRAKSVQTIIWK